ncbi:MAG TPA: WD40 repeat domain-containing protein [Pirellulales bacterium]|nr:WD40 repeat domain-containing protein [Pirellulales bacterium]
MASRRFTLAGLMLTVWAVALALGYAVPMWRAIEHDADSANRVEALTMSADGAMVAARFGDGKLRLWNAISGRLLNTIAVPFQSSRIALARDGRLVAAESDVGVAANVALWDVATGKVVREFAAAPEWLIEFSPTEDRFALAGGSTVFIHSTTDEDAAPVCVQLGASRATAIAFSPDGQTLAVGTDQSGVRLFDSTTGAGRQRSISDDGSVAHALAFSPDGRRLAMSEWPRSTPFSHRVRMLNLRSAKTQTLPRGDDFMWYEGTAYLPGGRFLAVVQNNELRLFDASSHQPVGFDQADGMVQGIAAGRRGPLFAVAGHSGIELRDCQTLNVKHVLWSGPPPPNFVFLGVGYLLWIVAIGWRAARRYARTCQTCGRRYQPLHRNEVSTDCPTCRERALYDTLTAEQIRLAERRKTRRGLLRLVGFCCLSALPLGIVLRETIGLRFWLAYVIAALAALVSLVACGMAYLWLRQ